MLTISDLNVRTSDAQQFATELRVAITSLHPVNSNIPQPDVPRAPRKRLAGKLATDAVLIHGSRYPA
jgi:hypothetical protein